MGYDRTGEDIAAAVLKVLPTHQSLVKHLPSDEDALIPEVTIIIVLLINA